MQWQRGDSVVYAKHKHSVMPGPRARDVDSAPQGEGYSYVVDKFWVVKGVNESGQLVLVTRRGKEHAVDPCDFNLKRPTLWQRWWHRQRYADVRRSLSGASQQTS